MKSQQFRQRNFLSSRSGKLFIEEVSASTLAEKFGTPLYIYSEIRIRENAQRVKTALQKYIPHSALYYAVKANNNLSILSILRSEGLGADAAGPWEIALAEKAGFARDKILYSGVFHSDAELKSGLKAGVAINLDSLSAAERLLEFGQPPVFSMRINPGISGGSIKGLVFAGSDAKFGAQPKDALTAYQLAKKAGVKRFGLHMMTGSCILNPNYFAEATSKLLLFAKEVHNKTGIEFDFIDIGGGLGIPYRANEKVLDIDKAISGVAKVFQSGVKKYQLGNPKLMLEPGRYLVCDAGVLLTRVHTIKQGAKKTFVGVDAGMQTLLRPMLYDAYHEILLANNLNARPSTGPERSRGKKVNVVGPICENTDQIAKDRLLPKLSESDLLAILDVGSYGFGMASQYNTRPRPAEVLVCGNKADLIREREDLAEIVGKQNIPNRLTISTTTSF